MVKIKVKEEAVEILWKDDDGVRRNATLRLDAPCKLVRYREDPSFPVIKYWFKLGVGASSRRVFLADSSDGYSEVLIWTTSRDEPTWSIECGRTNMYPLVSRLAKLAEATMGANAFRAVCAKGENR